MKLIQASLLALLTLAGACRGSTSAAAEEGGHADQSPTAASLSVSVDAFGYHPGTLYAPAGKPVQLTLTRTSDEGCGQQVVFPSLDIRRDLPLSKPVRVDLTMPKSGSISFTCGMNMLRGSIVAQ